MESGMSCCWQFLLVSNEFIFLFSYWHECGVIEALALICTDLDLLTRHPLNIFDSTISHGKGIFKYICGEKGSVPVIQHCVWTKGAHLDIVSVLLEKKLSSKYQLCSRHHYLLTSFITKEISLVTSLLDSYILMSEGSQCSEVSDELRPSAFIRL